VSTATTQGRRARLWRILALLLAFTLVAAACGGDDDDASGGSDTPGSTDGGTSDGGESGETDTSDVTTGGTLIVGLEAEQNNWLPGLGTFANSGTTAARAVYDSIAARGEDGNVYPFLAESIEPNEDLTEWTVTLREGIKFHDGTDLTAEVMKRIFDEYLRVEGAAGLPALINEVEEVRVDDELTYTYVLSRGIAPFPDALVGPMGWPFSIEACEAAGGRDGDCGERMVGTGPFVFVSWTRDSELRLQRNPDYWRVDAEGRQLPYLDELIFRPIPDEDARLNAVAAGDTHVGQTLRQSSVRSARELDGVVSYEAIGNNGGGSIFNTSRPPVDDVRVRKALAYAVKQEDLVKVLGGEGITPPQTQFFSPDSPWYSTVVEEAWPDYDPDLAREFLDDYINDPDRSDGKAPGSPVSVEFNCPPDPTLIEISQAYQAFWNDIGVEVTLNQVEQATHIGNAVMGEYMINCWRAGGNEDPYITLTSAFTEGVATNFTRYHSDTIYEQLEVLRTSTDFDERYAAVETIMLELADQVPQIWTGGTATALFVNESVRNIDGWTIPGPDRAPLVRGDGVMDATVFWAEVWIEQ
jgi:peptide/nickel transport system substrate-binding protein